MAYVAPSSRAVFYKGTGLTPSYENTLYFASESAKDSYFGGLSGFDTSRISYQRENRNFIRIETNIANLYNCDYMRFKNDSFENKWFYAFVTAINYINNITTEVVYQLDPLMTWMGTFTLGQCYVERQHVRNDSIGANIADEGISTGPYVQEGVQYSSNYGNGKCDIRIQYANPNEAEANMFGGVYNPTKYLDTDSASTMAKRIQDITDDDLADNIVNVYMVPRDFANPSIKHVDKSVSKPYSDVAGYTPKNKKLYCYPYKYLEVDNSEGSSKVFKYEYFNSLPDATSTGDCNFDITGTCVNSVELILAPKDYNGNEGEDYTNTLSMTKFPICAWTIDVYKAYLAQRNAFYAHDTAQAVVQGTIKGVGYTTPSGGLAQTVQPSQTVSPYSKPSTALAPVSNAIPTFSEEVLQGLPAGASFGTIPSSTLATYGTTAVNAGVQAGLAGLSSIANNMIDNLIQPEAGSRMHGSPSNDTMFQQGVKRFTFHKMSITKNYAMMIDNYFTMYGYKIRQVLVPNMNARPHWTYLKTIGCNVGGSLPASDKQAIENILDNGTRFWHNLTEMGNYSLDNSPS